MPVDPVHREGTVTAASVEPVRAALLRPRAPPPTATSPRHTATPPRSSTPPRPGCRRHAAAAEAWSGRGRRPERARRGPGPTRPTRGRAARPDRRLCPAARAGAGGRARTARVPPAAARPAGGARPGRAQIRRRSPGARRGRARRAPEVAPDRSGTRTGRPSTRRSWRSSVRPSHRLDLEPLWTGPPCESRAGRRSGRVAPGERAIGRGRGPGRRRHVRAGRARRSRAARRDRRDPGHAGHRAGLRVHRRVGRRGPGDPLGRPLSARLGPDLLGGVFDGLLRPLAGAPGWSPVPTRPRSPPPGLDNGRDPGRRCSRGRGARLPAHVEGRRLPRARPTRRQRSRRHGGGRPVVTADRQVAVGRRDPVRCPRVWPVRRPRPVARRLSTAARCSPGSA